MPRRARSDPSRSGARLRAQEHDVRLAACATAARESYETGRPRLIVLSEPAKELLTFCREVREHETGTPIVLAVAPAADQRRRSVVEAGATDEFIFDCAESERFRTQLALAAERIRLRVRDDGVGMATGGKDVMESPLELLSDRELEVFELTRHAVRWMEGEGAG